MASFQFRPPMQQQQPASEKALRSVYVGNIGFDVNEAELKQVLSRVGQVIGFRIVHDRETGKSKGFGFCEYLDSDTAQRCMRELNNLEFKGRNLRIDSAVSNERALTDDFSQPQSHNPMATMPPPIRPRFVADETSKYGPAPLNGKTPEAIAKILSKCSPEVMFEIMKDMKNLATTNPQRCRQLLETNPQLAFALLQGQVMMHGLDTDAALNLIDRKMNLEKAPEPSTAAPPMEPIHGRQPLRPIPTQQPPPQFQPDQPQFFQNSGPPPQGQFRHQQPQQQQQFFPPRAMPPAPVSQWHQAGPPPPSQRMPNAPPRFPPTFEPQQQHRFPPPNEAAGFRPFANRPPPPSFHNMPPPQQQHGHFPQPVGGGFRPNMPPPPLPQQHFQQQQSQRQSNDEHDEEREMIKQVLQLTEGEINQLPADEAAKIREIRAQFSQH